ncbi:hypothetical protein Tco_1384275 [Tanacetum coccineum]
MAATAATTTKKGAFGLTETNLGLSPHKGAFGFDENATECVWVGYETAKGAFGFGYDQITVRFGWLPPSNRVRLDFICTEGCVFGCSY